MDWDSGLLLRKAKVYALRAHDEGIESELFGFWLSLAMELLTRSALAAIHPVLLADPREEGNIHYSFGINPKGNPRSIQAKTVFARCSIFIEGFTDQMVAHCLILADRRNKELHTGAQSFGATDSSTWLPQTYEVMEVVLKSMSVELTNFFGNAHGDLVSSMLKDRRSHIHGEVQKKVAASRKAFGDLKGTEKATRVSGGQHLLAEWAKTSPMNKVCECPACSYSAALTGESLNRGSVKLDENNGLLTRELRVLPNSLRCPTCHLKLDGYQELLQVNLGQVFVTTEEEDPIEFFGIVPEDHVDMDKVLEAYYESQHEYDNE
ncbi:hypothetical protein [Sphingomonas sp. CFBP 13720]|uniref:hypothetical protein n=1 Tax=Sphingomonas sp. CFBP 13720 TaxID=2775302 RepID=UPI00177B086E|nr:hypothetical protein [Sphingomonas sp. CFBP 13720]MBD8680005.1 hypothetical protein [Sphingomonas sp. CFBP 13720]